MYELFIEPLTYGFMQRGLLVTVLAALVCALLSCWLVLMGWSLMGDGISHAVLPGVALAYILVPLCPGRPDCRPGGRRPHRVGCRPRARARGRRHRHRLHRHVRPGAGAPLSLPLPS